jgi:very-short-patch-repair endonuclease
MTHAEVLLWNYIRRRQIHNVRFRRQFSILHFIVDFYSPELLIAIEVDGVTHQTEDEIKYDIYRENELNKSGIEVLRFTNEEVYEDITNVLEKVRSTVEKKLAVK